MPTIAERFGQRLRRTRSGRGQLATPGCWQHTLEEFRVPDVGPAEAQAWFVCESPHNAEVAAGAIEERYPLRGRSGATVTRALIECGHLCEQDGQTPGLHYIPVGELVRRRVLDSVRVVNVCELPLQLEAYAQHIDHQLIERIPGTLPFKEWAQILLAFRTVRDLRVNDHVPTDQPLVCDVLQDFHDRVAFGEDAPQPRVMLCGRTANACWRVLELPFDIVRCVAHPSRGGWYRSGQVKPRVRQNLHWLLQTNG